MQAKLDSMANSNKKLDNIEFLKETASKDLTILLRRCKLNERISELLLDKAMKLEQYFVQESVKKAIKAEQYNEGTSSSFVDEVFFIFKQSAER